MILGGFGRGGGNLGVGQAREFGLAADDEGVGVFLLLDVLGKRRLERGNLGVEGLQLGLVGIGQLRAGADEIQVVALEQPERLAVETEVLARLVERLDPGEERAVQENGIIVRRQLGGHGAVNGFQRRVGVGAGEVGKDGFDAVQQLARTLHGDDGVLEGRGLGIVRNSRDLLQLLRHALLEGRREMLVLDLIERRQVIGQGAFGQQGIGGHGEGGGGSRVRGPKRGGEAQVGGDHGHKEAGLEQRRFGHG